MKPNYTNSANLVNRTQAVSINKYAQLHKSNNSNHCVSYYSLKTQLIPHVTTTMAHMLL